MKTFFQKGFAAVETILFIVVLAIMGGTAWYVLSSKNAIYQTYDNTSNSTVQPSKSTNTVQSIKLSAAPADFKQVVTAHAQTEGLCYQNGSFYDEAGNVTDPEVQYMSSGYAVAPVCNSAGLYAKVDGKWQFLATTQFLYECSMLRQYKVPAALIGDDKTAECDSNNTTQTYQ